MTHVYLYTEGLSHQCTYLVRKHACVDVQVVARCKEDIIKAKGVKPTLSPNLNTLATVEALDVKKLLFIGVGCQVRTGYFLLSHSGLLFLPFLQSVLNAIYPQTNPKAVYVILRIGLMQTC